MKIQNAALVDVDGTPIRDQVSPGVPAKDTDPILTVAKVLERAALQPPQQGQPFTDKQNADRYAAAVYLHKIEEYVPFELELDLVTQLKAGVMRSYAPLVAGQMVSILEGIK